MEGGHLLGEPVADLGAESIDPFGQHLDGGGVQSVEVVGIQAIGPGERPEPGPVHDLVGVGAADAADQTGVGEASLQGVALRGECRAKAPRHPRCSGSTPPRSCSARPSAAPEQVDRCPLPGALLGEEEGVLGEVEGRQTRASWGWPFPGRAGAVVRRPSGGPRRTGRPRTRRRGACPSVAVRSPACRRRHRVAGRRCAAPTAMRSGCAPGPSRRPVPRGAPGRRRRRGVRASAEHVFRGVSDQVGGAAVADRETQAPHQCSRRYRWPCPSRGRRPRRSRRRPLPR